jgi:hypothetical protein
MRVKLHPLPKPCCYGVVHVFIDDDPTDPELVLPTVCEVCDGDADGAGAAGGRGHKQAGHVDGGHTLLPVTIHYLILTHTPVLTPDNMQGAQQNNDI